LIKENPFVSDTFVAMWMKHYYNDEPPVKFDFINQVKFVKKRKTPIYINVGWNLTHGISYSLTGFKSKDYKNKVCFLNDIPSYFFNQYTKIEAVGNMKVQRIKWHKGFLARLDKSDSLDEFLKNRFNSKTRGKFKSYVRRLENCFDIKYSVYHGEIEKNDFNQIYEVLQKLLKKRFENKEESMLLLNPLHWDYFYELSYKMILEKKAFLAVIYNRDVPISISFNYCNEDFIFGSVTTFDIDYAKFSLGHISFMKIIECL